MLAHKDIQKITYCNTVMVPISNMIREIFMEPKVKTALADFYSIPFSGFLNLMVLPFLEVELKC